MIRPRLTTPTLLIILTAAIVARSGALMWAAECLGLAGLSAMETPAGPIAGIDFTEVRVGPCLGGFDPGDAFGGTAQPGQIVRATAAGDALPWVTLPDETSPVRGNIYQDRACILDGDLVVVTSTDQGGPVASRVWRVTSAGVPTLVATIQGRANGVVTVANDAVVYGPVAGRILVAGDDRLFAIAPAGDVITVGAATGDLPNYTTSAALQPVDLDLIPASREDVEGDADLIGVDAANNRMLTAPAAGFACHCGNILVTTAVPDQGTSGLAVLTWNGTSFDVSPVPNSGTETAGRWQAIAFRGGADCRSCSGVIGNYLWQDVNGDGVRDDGEPAIAGAMITLTRTDVASFRVSVTSDAAGAYQFTGLCAGTYVVTVPESAALTTALAGGDRSLDSNGSGTAVSLATDGDSDMTIGFGFR